MLARGTGKWRGAKARISRATVRGLERGDWITDTVLPGFKVRRPNRLALYGLNIRLQGRMRWISLGTEADLYAQPEARSEAERILWPQAPGAGPGVGAGSPQGRLIGRCCRRPLYGRTCASSSNRVRQRITPRRSID